MNLRAIYFLAALALSISLIVGISFLTKERNFILFEGLEGPHDRSVVTTGQTTSTTKYEGGGKSRLSVLLTDTNSAWLGLVHGLKSAGIPFSVTTDFREAIGHKVVLVYPMVSGSVLKPEALQALAKVPRNGGTLIGSMVLGGGLQEVFGFEDAIPSRNRFHADITEDTVVEGNPWEKRISLGDADADGKAIGTYAYTNPRTPPIATFDDGSAAIIHREVGTGNAYALGIDLGALLLKGQNNREEGYARGYVNTYEPMLDVLLRLLGGIYRKADDRAVFLGAVPNGKDLAVIITHDIDYTHSLANSIDYARLEHSLGISATYFIQTKYMRDWNDSIILNETAPDLLKKIRDMGMELASHGVSHSLLFHNFPLGDGNESYPAYRPFVKNASTTLGGTILGELRVSRHILERLVEGVSIKSFRPGHLSNPYALPQALQATGYAYSSSVTANNSLTHLPFQLNQNRDVNTELPVFEFPVTIEDESLPPLGERLEESVSLARNIARHGGVCVVLIHPNILGHKLAFERDFISAVKDFSWFGSLGEYGKWWHARNEVQVDSEWQGDRLIIHLSAPKPLKGLTLKIPSGLSLDTQHPSRILAEMVDGRIVLGPLEGSSDIRLVRKSADTL
ncbi:MAG: polysaccharide deacetylase family protein [Rhodospirillales bacterium]|jgi:peptidoglycan/xylan/chitin deacetylase (PgdA/CDA1 family)|nr:polysaccharide deacetylase family protein [Rhodospirillales bacterium]